MSALLDKAVDLKMLRLQGERLADIVLTTAELEADATEGPLSVPATSAPAA